MPLDGVGVYSVFEASTAIENFGHDPRDAVRNQRDCRNWFNALDRVPLAKHLIGHQVLAGRINGVAGIFADE